MAAPTFQQHVLVAPTASTGADERLPSNSIVPAPLDATHRVSILSDSVRSILRYSVSLDPHRKFSLADLLGVCTKLNSL